MTQPVKGVGNWSFLLITKTSCDTWATMVCSYASANPKASWCVDGGAYCSFLKGLSAISKCATDALSATASTVATDTLQCRSSVKAMVENNCDGIDADVLN